MAGSVDLLPWPVVGYRQDRSGARLIGVLDMIRLSRKFGVETRFLWLSQPDGPYPELADPGLFFGRDLIADYIRIVTQAPDLLDRNPLSSTARRLRATQFDESLAAGGRFYGGAIIEVARFADETPADVAAELRAIMVDLPLAPRLAQALAQARQMIAAVGQTDAAAIHVRRGDILDGDPWSYRAWPSKYVPDEFFRQFAATHDGPVIAFSDTPAAVRHLAQGDGRILAVDDLLAGLDLTLAERDMLELLLMAECRVIAAPSASAFSQAAAMIGGAQVVALPAALPGRDRARAYDDLLTRVIAAPDSFFAPGDLAQSLVYATQHAIEEGRAAELLAPDVVPPDPQPDGFSSRFPFVRYWQAMAAFTADRHPEAQDLAKSALASPYLRNAERIGARQIITLGEVLKSGLTGNSEDLARLDARFLTLAFSAAGSAVQPVLAHEILRKDGPAVRALMLDRAVCAKLAYTPDAGIAKAVARIRGAEGLALPDWAYLSSWTDVVAPGHGRENLSRNPGLWTKLSIGGDLLRNVLRGFENNTPPEPVSLDEAEILGFCAMNFGLYGRLKRAFKLLHWLDRGQAGSALTHKRLADCCYLAGNLKAAERWLISAMELAPQNALLRVAAAHRMMAQQRFSEARDHLDRAGDLWPNLGLIESAARGLKRTRRSAAAKVGAARLT